MSDSSSDSEGAASDASTPRLEVTDEQKSQSEELKTEANAKFQENHFADATDLYTKAIELNPRNHILYANRAFCHIKMENYGELSTVCLRCCVSAAVISLSSLAGIAITDSTEAINLDPSYIKVHLLCRFGYRIALNGLSFF
jgi:hypothetical protein